MRLDKYRGSRETDIRALGKHLFGDSCCLGAQFLFVNEDGWFGGTKERVRMKFITEARHVCKIVMFS